MFITRQAAPQKRTLKFNYREQPNNWNSTRLFNRLAGMYSDDDNGLGKHKMSAAARQRYAEIAAGQVTATATAPVLPTAPAAPVTVPDAASAPSPWATGIAPNNPFMQATQYVAPPPAPFAPNFYTPPQSNFGAPMGTPSPWQVQSTPAISQPDTFMPQALTVSTAPTLPQYDDSVPMPEALQYPSPPMEYTQQYRPDESDTQIPDSLRRAAGLDSERELNGLGELMLKPFDATQRKKALQYVAATAAFYFLFMRK